MAAEQGAWRRAAKTLLAALSVLALGVGGYLFARTSGLLNDHAGPPGWAHSLITERDWNDSAEANVRLTAALRARFPDGTDMAVMKAALLGDGFHERSPYPSKCKDPVGNSNIAVCDFSSDILEYAWGGVPCGQEIDVTWVRRSPNRLAHIKGSYGVSCL